MKNFVTVSTAAIPPAGQATEWARAIGERFSERFGGRLFDPATGESFSGQIGYADVGQIQLCRLAAQGHRVENTPGSEASSSRYKLTIQLEGTSEFEQDGLKAKLSPGHWAIYDTARPYLMNAPDAIHVAIATIPKDMMRLSLTERCALVHPLTSHSGAGLALSRYIIDRLQAFELSPELDADASADPIEQDLTTQIRIALQDQVSETRKHLHPRMLRTRIIEYIEQNLADPELTVERIALDLNCSKRYLHTVFDSGTHTLSRYILQLRLMHVCRDLGNLALQQCSITQLAMKWGFVSPGHFSRTFKEMFGVSPRDYRRGTTQTSQPSPLD
ncbi:helix-turn-helix domain-containing protein [Paraburkholderia sp. Ac-20342]|uniref:helix-turn-helix domain-containing protein n=1 Tax=Paraburkholderia sp. Ac-20342 TaxID=2703889 RepID=UPI00197CF802|nr:helix-turn-helix domain-containing protein [Paraburkholderia sp. Ac-20342]MBN3845896.1 helix-turn-helix domain-containing protein [Paraburkholderia sp. Ac-20342]